MMNPTENTMDTLAQIKQRNDEQLDKFMDRLLAVAQPGAVFSAPVVSGSYTVITASQVTCGGGFGSGFGAGPAPAKDGTPAEADTTSRNAVGGGMGGGGGASGRPIAAIVIGPDGVEVKPIVDATQIGLAVLTTAVAMITMFRRFRRAARRG